MAALSHFRRVSRLLVGALASFACLVAAQGHLGGEGERRSPANPPTATPAPTAAPILEDRCLTGGDGWGGAATDCGWQATSRASRRVYTLPYPVSHGMVQVAVRGFQPSSLFKAQSHYKDEKYHVLGAGNYYSWRYQGGNRVIQGLDHHSDHGGDFGWSLHAIPHPGVKKGDENDFKLLA